MLTVTEGAAARLAEILVDEAAPAEVVVRLFISGEQLAMKLDTERGGDTTVEYDGQTVLVLDGEVAELLSDEILDMDDSSGTPQLVILGDEEQDDSLPDTDDGHRVAEP